MQKQPLSLDIYFKLDRGALSEEFVAATVAREGDVLPYVAYDLGRDEWMTEEITRTRIGTAIVNPDTGDILGEFSGEDSLAKAQRAAASATVTFAVEVEDIEGSEEDEDIEDPLSEDA